MSEQFQPQVPGAPRKRKVFLGHAVEKGFIRFLSVKQIMLFAPDSGGCPRKWAFEYLFGKKLQKTKSLVQGAELGEALEEYLTTGRNVLPPILQPAKHLYPTPGPDLECEKRFATGPDGEDILKAIAGRERLRDLGASLSAPEIAEAQRAIQNYARLTVLGIPIEGAADVRHRRGEFVDEDGALRSEVRGMVVTETIDQKTAVRVRPHKITRGKNAGMILPSYVLSAAEICNDVQMLGYGIYEADNNPAVTHLRLSHVQVSKTSRDAKKSTGLISVEQVRERWHRRAVVNVEKMVQVAGATDTRDVESNTLSCDKYTHVSPDDPTGKTVLKGCGHRYYCPLAAHQVSFALDLGEGDDEEETTTMDGNGKSAFDAINMPSPPNGAPQAPPAPLTEQQYADAVATARAQFAQQAVAPPMQQSWPQPPTSGPHAHPGALGIEGYRPGQPCNGFGYYANANGAGFMPAEPGHVCQACAHLRAPSPPVTQVMPAVAPPPPPAPPAPTPPTVAAVRPPDAPTPGILDGARPMPAEEIAKVEDPTLRAQLEAHAAAHAQREQERASTQPGGGASPWCQPQTPKIHITDDMLAEGSYTCHCGKTYTTKLLKPVKESDGRYMSTIPKHKPVNKAPAASAAPIAATSAAPLPSSLPTQMTIPVSTPSASPPPVQAGEMTRMVESMFGTEAQPHMQQAPAQALPQQVLTMPMTPHLPPAPPPAPPSPMLTEATLSVADAQKLLVKNIAAEIARAVIAALTPIAEGK